MNSIDWKDTVKKEARGVNDYDLGEVQDIGLTFVHTQRGIATKEQFYIPKYLVEGYDGSTLWFNVGEVQGREFIRTSPPLDADYRTKYRTTSSRPDIESQIPVIAQRYTGNRRLVRQLLVNEMEDLLSAENQLVGAIPKMAAAANDPQLKQSFQNHLEQTRQHVQRLQQGLQMLDEPVQGKPCLGMKGLIEEGEEQISEGRQLQPIGADLTLITAAQKVEHYEIAGYGTAKTMANKIGKQDVARLLEQTETEEKRTDELLTQTAAPMLQRLDSTTNVPARSAAI